MNIDTATGLPVDNQLVINYLKSLVNRFFKILPIRENNDDSLEIYLDSLLKELIGFKSLIIGINNNAMFMSLLSTLQYLIDNPKCSIKTVRRQVFNSISTCNKLIYIYSDSSNNS